MSDPSGVRPSISAYAGLHESSLAVALAPVVRRPARLTLLVPQLERDAFFAGMRTAVSAAVKLAASLELPLRIVALAESFSSDHYADMHAFLAATFRLPPDALELESRAGLIANGYGQRDAWVATYWTTAHALQVAATLGLVDPDRVAYLVQDFEPGFFGWSTRSTLAENTYSAGFHLAVNSLPLRDYLASTTLADVAPHRVFAPDFDLASLEAVAARRPAAGDVTRIFFYGRPGKPRNLFPVGVTALRLAIAELTGRGVGVEVVSAGLEHDPLDLGAGVVMSSLGTLDWEGYCDLLATVDVGLSLQKSAHPSHPPLEVAMSGAIAVTNDFSGTRDGLHPRLVVRPSTPEQLAGGLVEAVERSRAGEDRAFARADLSALGGALTDVVADLAAAMRDGN